LPKYKTVAADSTSKLISKQEKLQQIKQKRSLSISKYLSIILWADS